MDRMTAAQHNLTVVVEDLAYYRPLLDNVFQTHFFMSLATRFYTKVKSNWIFILFYLCRFKNQNV